MAKILVSACLLGCPCRYDGKSCRNEAVCALAEAHALVPVCPEQLGGLPTPRSPSEIAEGRVMMKTGQDVTDEYTLGARSALHLARLTGCTAAVLKSKSPSCGRGRVYDGTFSGTLRPGDGVTAGLLAREGLEVFTENDLEELKNRLKS
ncbi:MAG: DUF523 domain-containing protein [Oscillospiraceae bacterium]|nr:DUF523 domain-containing protein [Oscillospiraceae bacterium]